MWSGDYADGELHTLVLVSADSAVDPYFFYYAQRLKLADRLQALFFDDRHVSFTDSSYRQNYESCGP
jgi:hypothetical protein